MLQLEEEPKIIKTKDSLLKIFYTGFKSEKNLGVELEKLAVYKDSIEAVKYEDMRSILQRFDESFWEKNYENGNLLGLKSEIGNITLEPGSQIELSLKPQKNLSAIQKNIEFYLNILKIIEQDTNIQFLEIGSQPVSTFENINIIPKDRYRCMTQYLQKKALSPFKMMRETAGIQCSVDYSNERDAIQKLSLAIKLSPFVSTIFSNSPYRKGQLNNYKSNRNHSWLVMDKDRSGLLSKKLVEKPESFSFQSYIDILLDIPMIFIQRNNSTIYTNNLTFNDFIKNGFQGTKATIKDWETHLSLFFPDVRLKNYVEIRNHDCQKNNLIMAVPAFWQGIMYNPKAFESACDLVKDFDFELLENIRNNTPQKGLNYKYNNVSVLEIANKLLEISSESLKMTNEQKFIEPIIRLTKKGKTPADILIEINSK